MTRKQSSTAIANHASTNGSGPGSGFVKKEIQSTKLSYSAVLSSSKSATSAVVQPTVGVDAILTSSPKTQPITSDSLKTSLKGIDSSILERKSGSLNGKVQQTKKANKKAKQLYLYRSHSKPVPYTLVPSSTLPIKARKSAPPTAKEQKEINAFIAKLFVYDTPTSPKSINNQASKISQNKKNATTKKNAKNQNILYRSHSKVPVVYTIVPREKLVPRKKSTTKPLSPTEQREIDQFVARLFDTKKSKSQKKKGLFLYRSHLSKPIKYSIAPPQPKVQRKEVKLSAKEKKEINHFVAHLFDIDPIPNRTGTSTQVKSKKLVATNAKSYAGKQLIIRPPYSVVLYTPLFSQVKAWARQKEVDGQETRGRSLAQATREQKQRELQERKIRQRTGKIFSRNASKPPAIDPSAVWESFYTPPPRPPVTENIQAPKISPHSFQKPIHSTERTTVKPKEPYMRSIPSPFELHKGSEGNFEAQSPISHGVDDFITERSARISRRVNRSRQAKKSGRSKVAAQQESSSVLGWVLNPNTVNFVSEVVLEIGLSLLF